MALITFTFTVLVRSFAVTATLLSAIKAEIKATGAVTYDESTGAEIARRDCD